MVDGPYDPPEDREPDTESGQQEEVTQDVAEALRGDVRGGDPDTWPGRPTLDQDEVVGDRFRIVRTIACGGMGEVYEAEDLELGVRVALKVLRSRLVGDPQAVERLRREIHLTRQVAHVNVCRVFDVFRHRRPGAGEEALTGFTMELLQGETLAQRLIATGPMSPEQALPLVRQMAAALDAAHRAGVVHRDFKSGNVMLVPGEDGHERVVVTDFGVARPVVRDDGAGPRLTADNLVLGTADYMAPEQAQGAEVTPASDIYALGVVIFEMITGRRPHTGDTPLALLVERVKKEPPSPREVMPGLDPRWDEVVLRCLARDPGERFGSACEVAAALAAPTADAVATDSGAAVLAVSGAHAAAISPASRRLALAAVAFGVCAALAAALWVLWRGTRATEPGGVSGPAQLTTWPGLEIDPSLSPGGGSVAFSANHSGRFEVYVKQLAVGSREIQLTADGEQNFQPAWSPDGSSIAYASHGRGGIWLIPALGGRPRRLTDFGSHPEWSPDGSLIAFQESSTAELSANAVAALPPSTIWLVRAGGGEPWPLTRPGKPAGGHGDPQWSPDGRRIVFTTSDRRWSQIWSVGADGEGLREMVTEPAVVFDPLFSPDGRWLYYSAVSEGERHGVWRLAVSRASGSVEGGPIGLVSLGMASVRHFALSEDGRTMVHTALATVSNLLSLPVSGETPEPLGPPWALTSGTGRNSRPAFSPDGDRIAFDRWNVGTNQDIWLMAADGSGLQQLTLDPLTDSQASWLPDGDGVTFSSDRDGGWAVWSARLDGGDERHLATLRPGADASRLSPDGTRLAYHAADGHGVINTWTVRVDGGEPRQLTFDHELVGFPCWSPDGTELAAEMRRGEDDHVVVIPADGGPVLQLTSAPGKSWPYSWSPDGERIVFAALRDGFWNLWWVSRTSGEERQLTSFEQLAAYVRYPAWSPRGDQIVFEYAETTGDLWILEGLISSP